MLYSLLYGFALILLLPFEYKKRPREVRSRWIKEKLGLYQQGQRALGEQSKSSRVLWVHAVSVGEVIAATAFIREFSEKHPGYEIVVSTMTDTGQEVARARLGHTARVVYMPFDLGFVLRRAFGRIKPSLFVIMETELWPNVFLTLERLGVPLVIINGRISDRSFKGYLKVKNFMKKLLKKVDLLCMQDYIYANRIIELGAEREKVVITGSLKFDIKVKDEEMTWAGSLSRPVIVVGSTHRGEDEIMVKAYLRLNELFPGLNMVITPRHPERFSEVERVLKESGKKFMKRSEIIEGETIKGSLVLLDRMGELSSVYRACDVAVIGGSFVRHGGQNFLEPAFWGKPVVCGPHMENFPFVKEFYESGAALEADEEGLYNILVDLLSSENKRREIGEKARELVMKNSGAVQKALSALEERVRL